MGAGRRKGGADTEGMGVAGDSRWQGTPGTLCLQSLMRAHGQVSGAQDCLFTAPFPSMLPTPLTLPHTPLTPSLSLTCPSSLLTSAPGLEQLRNLRHLDLAYNLLEEHRELSPMRLLAELRKVSLRCLKVPGATKGPPHRETQGPSHSPSCFSALPGGEPFVVPPGAPSGHRPVLVTPSQGCYAQRE